MHRAYPGIVPALRDGQVQETVIMDMGVAPAGVGVPPAIKFQPRHKTCEMARVTGTQWQESESVSAVRLFEEAGREEEPSIGAPLFGRWAGF